MTSAHSNLLTKWLFFDRINTTPGLMPSTYRVIARLLAHHNTETEECFPSESTIAKALGISVRQVKYCIEELEEKGLIKVTRRFNDSNRYEFCWERAGVVMKQMAAAEKQEQESQQDGKQNIERVVEILSASRTKEDFERLYAEHAGHLNGELGKYIRKACDDVEDHHVKRFVEDLITAYPKSKKKHALYRTQLPKIVRGLRPMRGTLEVALGRLLEKNRGWLHTRVRPREEGDTARAGEVGHPGDSLRRHDEQHPPGIDDAELGEKHDERVRRLHDPRSAGATRGTATQVATTGRIPTRRH